jgi:hypothetical protein
MLRALVVALDRNLGKKLATGFVVFLLGLTAQTAAERGLDKLCFELVSVFTVVKETEGTYR